jgi:hypothetical protein
MAGEARPSAAYYIALSLLALGLLAGLSLFLLLATRPHSNRASVEWNSSAMACPPGGHGTACYDFTVSNTSDGPIFAMCELTPAPGTQAQFDNHSTVKQMPLLDGQTEEMVVSVVADQSSEIAEPAFSCSASKV